MPILKDDKGVLLIVLGRGDVAICPASHVGDAFSTEIIFHTGPEGEIGRVSNEGIGESINKLDYQLRISFLNTQSIQVLIGQLERLKEGMEKGSSCPST